MDLRRLLTALRNAWWMPVVGALVGTCAALGLSLSQTPVYTSSTQLFVSITGAASASDVLSGSQFSQQRVASYAKLIVGDELASRVVSRLGLHASPAAIKKEISAEAVPQTVLIDVDVTDPSPQRAQQIANAVGSEFTALASELEQGVENGSSAVKVTVTQPADLPARPSAPKIPVNMGLGLFAGILVGGGLAVGRARLDRSVKDAEEVAKLVGAPVIGSVLRDEELARGKSTEVGALSRTAEDYRQLRTNLQYLNVDEPPRVIMVSSAVPAEGKTTAVANLALALAELEHSVTVVEADLRRPKVVRYLGLVGGTGLTNILTGTADVDDVIQMHGRGQLRVIGAGPTPPNPGELLASSHMAALLDKLRGQNDYVLIDAPPLLPVADASGLAVHTDGVLLSVHYGKTRREQVHQAAVNLHRVGANLLGVILNIVPPNTQAATAYGYGYGYEYIAALQERKGR